MEENLYVLVYAKMGKVQMTESDALQYMELSNAIGMYSLETGELEFNVDYDAEKDLLIELVGEEDVSD
jgi:hypothetical protein